MIKRFKRSFYVDAIQFLNTPENIQEIIEFINLPISVDYTSQGVKLRIYGREGKELIANLNDYIFKYDDGSLDVMSEENFRKIYEEVIEP